MWGIHEPGCLTRPRGLAHDPPLYPSRRRRRRRPSPPTFLTPVGGGGPGLARDRLQHSPHAGAWSVPPRLRRRLLRLTTVEDGRVVPEGDPINSFTRGQLCARMSGIPTTSSSAPTGSAPAWRTGKKGEVAGCPGTRSRRWRASSRSSPSTACRGAAHSYAGTEGKIQASRSRRFFAARLRGSSATSAYAAHHGLPPRSAPAPASALRSGLQSSIRFGATPPSATSIAGTSRSRRRRRARASWSSTAAVAHAEQADVRLATSGTDAARADDVTSPFRRLHDATT
jgi:hypothetical protein